jgi:tetrahydromethanopterin S-methyltransferase subunit G
MPEKLPGHCQVTRGPHSVELRPELAVKIASICAIWAMIEDQITVLYGLLMGTYLSRPADTPNAGPPLHPVALQVFWTLHALNNRLDLLRRLGKWRANEAENERIEELAVEINRCAAARSRVAHGLWGTCDDYPDALILDRHFDAMWIYQANDFQQVLDRLRDLHGELGKLTQRVFRRLGGL